MNTQKFCQEIETRLLKLDNRIYQTKFKRMILILDVYEYVNENLQFVLSEEFSNKVSRDFFLRNLYSKTNELTSGVISFDCQSDANKISTRDILLKLMIDVHHAIGKYFMDV
jgi:hypothetical protein